MLTNEEYQKLMAEKRGTPVRKWGTFTEEDLKQILDKRIAFYKQQRIHIMSEKFKFDLKRLVLGTPAGEPTTPVFLQLKQEDGYVLLRVTDEKGQLIERGNLFRISCSEADGRLKFRRCESVNEELCQTEPGSRKVIREFT